MNSKKSTMIRMIAGMALISTVSFATDARAQLTLSGVAMYGAYDINGDWNGSYDYWNTVGGDFGFNVYLFTGLTNSPTWLNGGNTDATLNPALVLSPGSYVIQFACDFHGWDPGTPYLGMNLYFNNDSITNQISAVVPNAGSCSFSVVGATATTYGEGNATPGSGSLSYTSGDLTATLSAFCTSSATPDLVSGYDNAPGSESDFIGSFTLTVAPAQPTLTIQPAIELAWNSSTNYLYQVQWSTNLAGSNWFNLGAPIQGDGATNYVFDTTTESSQRFYQVIVVQ